MKEVDLPDGSVGEFPDTMDDSAIEQVLKRQFPAPKPTGEIREAKGFLGKVAERAGIPTTLEGVGHRLSSPLRALGTVGGVLGLPGPILAETAERSGIVPESTPIAPGGVPTNTLEILGGIPSPFAAVRGAKAFMGRAPTPAVAAVPTLADEVAKVTKLADDLELPQTVLRAPPGTAPWQGAPGPAPELVTQRAVTGTPWAGAPSPVQQAEDVIRARYLVNTSHARQGTSSPLPPSINVPEPPITGLKPSDWATGSAKWMSKGNAFFTPQDIARGIPAAEQIVKEGFAAADAAHLITQDIGRQLQAIYKPVKGKADVITDIHRVLDGVPTKGPITPEIIQAASQVRAVFDKLADMAQLPKQARLADYFPHLREEVQSTLQLKITKEGKPITKEIPTEFRVFFQKQRTLPTDETIDYSLNAVNAYLNAAAKRISMKGGFLSDGRPVGGFLNRIANHLENLPDVPEIRAYYAQYVNDLAHGAERGKFQVLSPSMVATIKQVEFLRTIGANLMSPIQNILQTMNTFAKTDIRSWGAAWYDLVRNPEIVRLAKKSGLIDQTYSAQDLMSLSNPNAIQAMVTKGANKSAILFKKAEETNRLHAFAAGYRDALRKGLAGDQAADYAKDIVNQTQFRFGAENLPNWLRSPNAGRQLVGQYKQYQINQLNFLRNMAVRDPKGMAKWLTAGLMLGGQDIYGHAVGDQIRNLMSVVLGGDPKDYKFRGLLGEMGMWIGNQMGVGALPFEDMGGLAFLVPGPALGHLMSVVSGVSGRDFSPRAIVTGNAGQELSPDQRASHLTSSINVQLNRLRQAAVMAQAQGPNFRQADTLTQAFGAGRPTGAATIKKAPGEVARKAMGIPSVRSEEEFQARQRVVEDIEEYKILVRKKAAAIRRGDTDEVRRLNQEGMRQFGRVPKAKESARERARAERTPLLERILRRSPRQIRQQERKEAE